MVALAARIAKGILFRSTTFHGQAECTYDPRRQQGVSVTLHLDHGYVVTSHSSQGQMADRVLIHVDTELAAKALLTVAWGTLPFSALSRDLNCHNTSGSIWYSFPFW